MKIIGGFAASTRLGIKTELFRTAIEMSEGYAGIQEDLLSILDISVSKSSHSNRIVFFLTYFIY